ncbi:hypothetical protein HN51_064572 [Arachis hypogaea]|uniref:uncharacterized protein isoform X2 n=2 Tax=Arachis TaxID=3817 RepID=UPI0034E6B70B|nr:2-keto-3-deoxy-L-rhamnonate aldolase [Arachis hypogaea]QHO05619.1 2-keto-3-deoxy-L-rhamnonate aldolase [Arachis hypogaea]
MAAESKSLKACLISVGNREQEPLYGLFLATFSPTMAEIAAHSGYDFAVIDMLYGYGDIPNVLPCLHALSAAHTPSLIRLPESSAVWAKKALDIGPAGLIFPGINSPKSARDAVSYCAYPPKGVRGAAHPAVRASNYGLDQNYLSKCEHDLLIICQIDSEVGLESVKDIAAVDGVDCVMLGPLGPGLSPDKLRTAEDAVLELKASRGPGKGPHLAGFPSYRNLQEGSVELKKRGYHLVCGSTDVTLFRDAALASVNSFKSSTSGS